MPSYRPSIFCPFCATRPVTEASSAYYENMDVSESAPAPVRSPMGILFVESGKPATRQPFAEAHFIYVCPRCGYGEIHTHLLVAA